MARPIMEIRVRCIISPDGFIATNNHVVENASAVDVILPDKRTFTAKLIGRDPNTDLALLKVGNYSVPNLAIRDKAFKTF